MSHTPEPWEYGNDSIWSACNGEGNRMSEVAEFVRACDGNRIVACVNACAGLDNPAEAIAAAREALERAKWWLDEGSDDGCTCAESEYCSYCNKAVAVQRKIDDALAKLTPKQQP